MKVTSAAESLKIVGEVKSSMLVVMELSLMAREVARLVESAGSAVELAGSAVGPIEPGSAPRVVKNSVSTQGIGDIAGLVEVAELGVPLGLTSGIPCLIVAGRGLAIGRKSRFLVGRQSLAQRGSCAGWRRCLWAYDHAIMFY